MLPGCYLGASFYTANVCRDLRGFYGEIRVQGFQICRVYVLSAFTINSVGMPFMNFAGKLSYRDVVHNYMHI